MTVKKYMLDKIANGTMHAALIDPDKQPAEKAGEMAKAMKEAGTDIIFVGGSSGITMENLSATAKAVKEASGLPVILFGGTPDSLNKELDAVFFMQIVNERTPDSSPSDRSPQRPSSPSSDSNPSRWDMSSSSPE